MAAKRIAQSTVNWAAIAERVPSDQKPLYFTFKAQCDNYVRKVVALPEHPPKIDWALYKAKIPSPAMVDEFQKKYEAFKIPLPDDASALSQIAAAEKEAIETVKKFKEQCTLGIAEDEAELKACEAKIPISEMTLEELAYEYPDLAIDAKNNPTFWPHTPEMAGPENEDKEHH